MCNLVIIISRFIIVSPDIAVDFIFGPRIFMIQCDTFSELTIFSHADSVKTFEKPLRVSIIVQSAFGGKLIK